MAPVDLPIPLVVTRWKCPHCYRTRSSKRVTAEHIARCWHNPAARGCRTCANYYPGDNGCEGDPGCNCASPEFCNVSGIDLAGTLRTNCESWEANDDQPSGIPDSISTSSNPIASRTPGNSRGAT